jgi:hypothetical protein
MLNEFDMLLYYYQIQMQFVMINVLFDMYLVHLVQDEPKK